MLLALLDQRPLAALLGAVGAALRPSRAIPQPVEPTLAVPIRPLVAGFPADAVDPAQLRHRPAARRERPPPARRGARAAQGPPRTACRRQHYP